MDKVTQINVEGRDYGFVAGQAIKGICSSAASDYIKIVTLPEGADLVEGMLVDIRFANGNTAGFLDTQTIYSSDGSVYYWDSQLTEAVTIPPEGCYLITHVSGQQYSYKAWPILSVGGHAKPLCDIKGYARGGALWDSGDSVVVVALEDKYLALNTIANVVKQGLNIPVTSDGLYSWPETSITPNSVRPPTGNAVLGAINAALNNIIPSVVADAVNMSFDRSHPKGSTYDQYPGQKSPMDLWGNFSTWEILDYGGAFFRASGGSADVFEKTLTVNSVSGTTLSFTSAHGLNAGSVIYDYVHNEGRTVASVTNTTTVVLNSAFSHSNMTNVLIGQSAQNYVHSHTRGTMNITGKIASTADRVFFPIGSSGALYTSDARANYLGSYWEGGKSSQTLNFDASRNWTGATSENGGVDARPTNFTKVVWVRTA